LDLPYDRKEAEFFVVDRMKFGVHNVVIQNKFKGIVEENDLENLKSFEICELKTAFKPYKL